MEYKKEEFIAGKVKKISDKQKFIKEYATKEGWDIDNLTTEQLKEIKSQKGYKNPGMMCS